MYKLLITMSDDALEGAFARAARQRSNWIAGRAARAREALIKLEQERWDIWLVDAATLDGAQLRDLERLCSSCAACVVVPAQVFEPLRARWLEAGAVEVLAAPAQDAVSWAPRQLRLLEVRLQRHRATLQARAEGRRRGAELLGVNALVHALANSLDRSTIVYKTLSILVGMCRRGAVAYLELVEAEEGAEPEGLFSESEAELIDLEEESELPGMCLNVVDQLAADRLLVCLRPTMHDSWRQLIARKTPLVLRRRPALGVFPGLEPLWHRLTDGAVFLVPISGRSQVLGILVIAELELDVLQEVPFAQESLQAMAALLGGALENARLFAEINQAYQSLQTAQDQLVHAEKFAAVGHLAAQIAHEINNPSSFVISNLSVMLDYVSTISDFFGELQRGAERLEQGEALEGLMREHEIDFLREDLQALLTRSMSGLQRIHQIVQDLRYFAHDSGPDPGWVDLEGILDASLNLIKHELKYRATVEREYADVPHVFSDANKLSQVFLNLLVNAAQALEGGDLDEDYIRVGTIRYDERILIYVEDSGEGISPEVLPRIFEPFFTTKRRGEGTGLGLSISRDILRSLGGDIRVYSEVGEGTRFEVLLPIRSASLARDDRLRDSGSYRQPPELRRRAATPPVAADAVRGDD